MFSTIIENMVDGFKDWAKNAEMDEINEYADNFEAILEGVESSVEFEEWSGKFTYDQMEYIAEEVQDHIRNIIANY